MFRTNELLTLRKESFKSRHAYYFAAILSLAERIINTFLNFTCCCCQHLLGMFFMISSNNLLMFYLGLELSTIPLAALSNFDLDKRRSSEAAFKMIMSSAFSSGLLLFGISMLYGATGTLNFAGIKLISTETLSRYFLSSSCLQVSDLRYPLFPFIYGQPMCMRAPRLLLLLIFP